jgi:hypothetical protein
LLGIQGWGKYGVSVWKEALKMDGGDGCIAVQVHLTNSTQEMDKMVNQILYIFTTIF